MNSDSTLAEVALKWLETKQKTVESTTYSTYSVHVYKHIIPVLGNVRMEDITLDQIQNAINSWLKEGNLRTGEELSVKTVREVGGVITRIIKFYVKETKLPVKVIGSFEYTKSRKKEVAIFSKEEQAKIVKEIHRRMTPKNAGIALGLMAGMRIGEVCGLQWGDIDLQKKKIVVSKTLKSTYLQNEEGIYKTEHVVGNPKTDDSWREIPFGITLYNILETIKPEEDDCSKIYVVSGKTDPLLTNSLRGYYYRFLKKLNLPHLNFHCLRHTYGSKHVSCGTSIPVISKLMGHKDPEVTMKLYLHPQFDDMANAVQALEDKWM